MELPGLTLAEPAFATALDWLLCDGLHRLGAPDGESLYLRLSTRPIDQAPFVAATERIGEDQLRADVIAGGYRLVEPPEPGVARRPMPTARASCSPPPGPSCPEAVAAAELLAAEGIAATVLDLTSADRLYREWRGSLQHAGRTASAASARRASSTSPG